MHRLAFDGKAPALVIIEVRTFPELLIEHTNFLLKIFNDNLLVAVHPVGTAA